MKRYAIVLVCMAFLLNGCLLDGYSPRKNVLIRVQNASQFDFSEVFVNTSGGEEDYGNLGAGNYSIYKDFDFAYEYALVSVNVDGEILTFQPRDYDGATQLPNGAYTYQIDVDTGSTQPNLTLLFIED